MKKSLSVLEVYRTTLQQAQKLREWCKGKNPSELEPEEREEFYIKQETANALYGVCAMLEETEEVNPTRIQIDYYASRDFPAIGSIIERDGRKWKVVDNANRHITTAELIN